MKILLFLSVKKKLAQNFAHLTNFESVSLWHLWVQNFAVDKGIHNLQIFDYPQHSETTEKQSNIGGWLIMVSKILTHM